MKDFHCIFMKQFKPDLFLCVKLVKGLKLSKNDTGILINDNHKNKVFPIKDKILF